MTVDFTSSGVEDGKEESRLLALDDNVVPLGDQGLLHVVRVYSAFLRPAVWKILARLP